MICAGIWIIARRNVVKSIRNKRSFSDRRRSRQRPSSGNINAAQAFRLHANEPIIIYAQLLERLSTGAESDWTPPLTSMYSSTDGLTTYAYDSTGQLTGATSTGGDESYTYDANGNRTGDGYVIGTDNRLLSDGTYWYAYDAEGNRTARFIDVDQSQSLTTNDANVTKYTWDARNRLVTVTDYEKYGGSATQVVDYVYDTENRWIGKLVDADGDGKIDEQERYVVSARGGHGPRRGATRCGAGGELG